MSKEDELREILGQAAKEISRTQSNPRTWESWMVYLLACLEDQANKGSSLYRESFTEMLSALQDSIRNRFRTGGWDT
jgi:hypothetical protein